MKGRILPRIFVAVFAGVLFGFGLSLSGMVDPARVIGFLDLGSGNWDPSLIFVLGGAVAVAVPGVLLQRRLAEPVLDDRFHLSQGCRVDRSLVLGSLIFGAGWGFSGLCPGPAVAGLSSGIALTVVFVAAMGAGMVVHDRLALARPS
jgi:uncharacterized membrane protein YedE/YeeE